MEEDESKLIALNLELKKLKEAEGYATRAVHFGFKFQIDKIEEEIEKWK